eukprot:6364978-Alexandrium_andersonii.AAC.1
MSTSCRPEGTRRTHAGEHDQAHGTDARAPRVVSRPQSLGCAAARHDEPRGAAAVEQEGDT